MSLPPNTSPALMTKPKALGDRVLAASFEGPLPPPSLFRDYESICPGAAERILKMAENQASHRQKLEATAFEAGIEQMRGVFLERRIGQIFALVLSLAFLGMGAFIALHGESVVGGLIGTLGISTIAVTFITGREKDTPDNPTPKKKKGRQSR
jgi:uncharacterized membrane protein